MAEPQPFAVPATRLVFIDRLRVVATVLIFAYHCARPFDDFERWHIKYDDVTAAFNYPMGIGSQFIMPLFWVLSGIGTWLALQSLSPTSFLRRRLVRLLVPVVTVGWFILCPVQVYIEATTSQLYDAPPFAGSFWEFLPLYFTSGVYGFGGWFPVTGLHLWYLSYLALFTLVSMPLFLHLNSVRGRRLVQHLASAAHRWWLLLVLGLPLLVTEVLLPPGIPILSRSEGGWRLGTHWVFLILGFVIGSDVRLRDAAQRWRRLWLGLAVTTMVPLLLLAQTLRELPWGAPDFWVQWTLRTLNGWLCLLAIIGYGARHLRRPSRSLAVAGELVLPFYILHQAVIVLFVQWGRGWGLPIAVAFPLLVVAAFLTCAAGCAIIRKHAALRFLFGMSRLRPRPAVAAKPQFA